MNLTQITKRFILYVCLHVLSLVILNYPVYLIIGKQEKIPKLLTIFVTFTLKTYLFNWIFFYYSFKWNPPNKRSQTISRVVRGENSDVTKNELDNYCISKDYIVYTRTNYPKDGGDYNYYWKLRLTVYIVILFVSIR